MSIGQRLESIERLLASAKAERGTDRRAAQRLLERAQGLARTIADEERVSVTVPASLDALSRWTVHTPGYWSQ